MKPLTITRTRRETLEVDTLRVRVPVEYDDEDMPFDFPFRRHIDDGDVWEVDIDLGSPCIKNWPVLTPEQLSAAFGDGRYHLFMKVVDAGVYTLLKGDVVVATRDGYVPVCLQGDGGDGDYLDIVIAADGAILDWTGVDLDDWSDAGE